MTFDFRLVTFNFHLTQHITKIPGDFMALEEKDFLAIEDYFKNNLARILSEQSLGRPPVVYEIELRERMVRVEEELKTQRELMNKGFEMMDRRFEQVERRFEHVERRLEELSNRIFKFMVWSFGLTVSAAGVIIAVIKM